MRHVVVNVSMYLDCLVSSHFLSSVTRVVTLTRTDRREHSLKLNDNIQHYYIKRISRLTGRVQAIILVHKQEERWAVSHRGVCNARRKLRRGLQRVVVN